MTLPTEALAAIRAAQGDAAYRRAEAAKRLAAARAALEAAEAEHAELHAEVESLTATLAANADPEANA